MSLVETTTRQVIAEKTSKNEQFTAYDVTNAVRAKLGTSVRVNHVDVKAIVHSEFDQLPSNFPVGYTRKLSPVASPQPWLYFPVSSNPDEYDEDTDDKVADGNISLVQTGVTGPNLDAIRCTVTAESRVNIPLEIKHKVIPVPLSGYSVMVDGKPISKPVYSNADGRLRISVSYDPGTEVDVSADKQNNTIRIEKI